MNAPFDNFNASTMRWEPSNALALAQAANLAYSDEVAVRARLNAWGFDLTQFQLLNDPQTDTQGFVVGNDQMILVTSRTGGEKTSSLDMVTESKAKMERGQK